MDAASTRIRLKRWASRAAHDARDHAILKFLTSAAVQAEVAAASAWASRRRVGPVAAEGLTVVVKTFERPDVLRRMLASLRRVYAGPVVVADDSREPFQTPDPQVRVLRLSFDSGIGAGRNALLDAVDTEYVLMADDDMILLPDFDVRRPLAYLQRNQEVSVVGGRVIHLPQWRTADYSAAALYAYRGDPLRREGALVDGLPVSYKVPNFYVARTAAVRGVRYDDRLKRVDHNDFFTSAYGRLVCVVDPRMVCLHAHSYFDAHYQSFRMDTAADLALVAAKWGPAPRQQAPAASHGLRPEQRVPLHHAAVEVVARELGLAPVHLGTPADPVVTVRLPAAGREALVPVLATLGWSTAGPRLRHPLWGDLRVLAGEGPDAARPASFATITGLAADADAWPDAIERREVDPHPDVLRWSPRAGFVDDGEVIGAALPLGPVVTLGTPGDLLWETVGPDGQPLTDAVAAVLSAFDDPGPDAPAQLRAYAADLVSRGLLATQAVD